MQHDNTYLNSWVKECIELYQPEQVVWYDGSDESYQQICSELLAEGYFTKLNEEKYPNSFWAKSNPNDVARVESRTFICSKHQSDAGPTNNWVDPREMREMLNEKMAGCMQGRTMYVIPYLMGPKDSPYARFGIELTDSTYVLTNMHIMTMTGSRALAALKSDDQEFVRGVHSKGVYDTEERYIAHFPETKEIFSFNTNYGGNVIQCKKCFALRLASVMARDEQWMAEHMLILGITRPDNKKFYVAAAFPSACGKTNLAMLIPPKKYADLGWKVETVGDDIAWLNIGEDGRLYAINPEQGFFGVAPGTSADNNPNALLTLQKGNALFTNTAYDPEKNEPWWQELSEMPERLINWHGEEHDPNSGERPDHPNSRFTVPAGQCPSISPEWQSPQGVPISAIIFGGRRAKSAPLVYEAFNWQHGTFVGATLASETTAAAIGDVGVIRRDPMAMRPFIGYHVGDYFQHWLDIAETTNIRLPKIFHVNWFRTNDQDKFIWPGFGDNLRVLDWVTRRITNECEAVESEIGLLPKLEDLDCQGLDISEQDLQTILSVDPQSWLEDIRSQQEFFKQIGDKLPDAILQEHQKLAERLGLDLESDND